MAALFHISTTDRVAAQHAGMCAPLAFAGAWTVNEMIAPAGSRPR